MHILGNLKLIEIHNAFLRLAKSHLEGKLPAFFIDLFKLSRQNSNSGKDDFDHTSLANFIMLSIGLCQN